MHRLLLDMKKTDPAEYRVVGKIRVPDWRGVNNHFQGIAPLNGVTKITGQISASADEWWCASFVESGNPATVTDVFGTDYYDHAGGIQRLGDLLAVPLENDREEATVAFYDVSGAARHLYDIPIVGKASAVAITNYRDGAGVEYAILLVYRYDPKCFHIYRAPVDELSAGIKAWECMGETRDIKTEDDDQFQCFAMVTEARSDGNDNVVLLGFREDEEVVRYNVSTQPTDFGAISPVQWTYIGWEGSQWRYGVGLQIASPTLIRIFGCSEDPSGDRDDYTFPIYYWG